ncbi:MAG: NAD(P)/FAD-dependent oxidoreductase [Thermosediminibacteraceae bacterium]|nr:NAD(P)/FAD-dependent oxidoreductase [Thermosediminibacteraceae bacterium]
MQNRELVIIGGGPAGLSAAVEARRLGIEDVLVIDRESEPGGILKQCIHTGFGLHIFKEELTGPEYAERFIRKAEALGVEIMLDTMVIELTSDRRIVAVNGREGLVEIQAKAIILAMGCRERTRGAIKIPGFRPAGIFTAGTAQRFVNIEGYMPGCEIVILGSGDIGLIMARRLTLEGAKVRCVVEIMPYSNGLTRNIVQCLEDYSIPLLLKHTVVNIHGKKRVEGVTIAEVDDEMKPIMETAQFIPCDTLLLSVGLIPENELSRMAGIEIDDVTGGPVVNQRLETSVPGIFACGNVLHVHDLVDFVTQEAMEAARGVASYLADGGKKYDHIPVTAGEGLRYVLPQRINVEAMTGEKQNFFMRCARPMARARLYVESERGVIESRLLSHVKPSEMISIKLGRDELKGVKMLKFILQEEGDKIECND